MLQAKTKEQQDFVESLLNDDKSLGITEYGVKIDDMITFDEMANIVDYLRNLSPQKELFEKCWVAYGRKGIKKKALDYWKKLTDNDREKVLPHIKCYCNSREPQYQKDFERYLRDKVFLTIVYQGNTIIYDPTKNDDENLPYSPVCGGSLTWNEWYKCFLFIGYWDGKHIADGYDDHNRPDGATIMLNNGRGLIRWNGETKTWDKI
jgi:hypothetical protein